MTTIQPSEQPAQKELPTLSLLDYLRRPAGEALGAAVYQLAKTAKEPVKTRVLNESYYKGKVMVYRPSFLKFIFTEPILQSIIQSDAEEFAKKGYKASATIITGKKESEQLNLPF
jgi:hypothetical protein|tara:strand:+ start:167 stop:511 length:345 start_codon:yes stop_codon:yes gene_type:complete